jgi:hypothetical protein
MNELELFAALGCVFNTEVHGGITAIRVPWVPQGISESATRALEVSSKLSASRQDRGTRRRGE